MWRGGRAGLIGTLAFIISGRLGSGAHAIESFVCVIDEDLARVR